MRSSFLILVVAAVSANALTLKPARRMSFGKYAHPSFILLKARHIGMLDIDQEPRSHATQPTRLEGLSSRLRLPQTKVQTLSFALIPPGRASILRRWVDSCFMPEKSELLLMTLDTRMELSPPDQAHVLKV